MVLLLLRGGTVTAPDVLILTPVAPGSLTLNQAGGFVALTISPNTPGTVTAPATAPGTLTLTGRTPGTLTMPATTPGTLTITPA